MKKIMLLGLLIALSLPASAFAFCGFYVAPGDAKLVNNATRVALMRHKDKTVLSLQPDYQGPAAEFAMVIPVPEILEKEEVKTLEPSLFDTLDQFTSPRMSEYWEQDPCPRPKPKRKYKSSRAEPSSAAPSMEAQGGAAEPAFVKVEAQFAVGEYDIVILNSNNATALEKWLTDQKYNIPDGAAPYLAPYISSGMYFFVAKVDPKRAKFQGNQAILSPLRFHYTSKDFTLPIRLGMINAGKEQDIVVFVLGETRYVPSNYPHAPIPTNLIVKDKTRDSFAEFYEGLYAKTRAKNEDAVITEYVWELATVQQQGGIQRGRKCDPCTSSVSFFTPEWMLSLGLDVFGVKQQPPNSMEVEQWGNQVVPVSPEIQPQAAPADAPKKLVVTRLHGRFKPDLKNPDIMFQKADPLYGGMGTPDKRGRLEPTKFHDSINMFQGRYVMLHRWEGEIKCAFPKRGLWGGPPRGGASRAKAAGGPNFGGGKTKSVAPEDFAKRKIRYNPPKAPTSSK